MACAENIDFGFNSERTIIMLTILAFIVTLGILVTVHEYGHFQVARWCGVKVLKFSVGFGKPLWSRKIGRDQTEFTIAAIPLGGYVKMLGEDAFSEENAVPEQDKQRAFHRQTLLKRALIVLAGPAANFVLAIVLYWMLFMSGVEGMKPYVGEVLKNTPAAQSQIQSQDLIQKINGKPMQTWQDVRWALLNESLNRQKIEIEVIDQTGAVHLHTLDISGFSHDDVEEDVLEKVGLTVYRPKMAANIGEVESDSPAAKAGLKTGDLILAVNNKQIADWESFVQEVRLHPAKQLEILIQRGAEQQHLKIIPEPADQNGETIGRIGAAFKTDQALLEKYMTVKNFSTLQSFVESVAKTWETAIFSLKMLGNMMIGNVSWKSMSGPVSIASYAGQSANMGVKVFIGFLALVSISIGVLNLLPIPILDGGHLMYYIVEFFTGKPVSEAVMIIGQRVGLFVLGWMMVLALYNDMNRLITG